MHRYLHIIMITAILTSLSACGTSSVHKSSNPFAYIIEREKWKPRWARESIFSGTPGKNDNDSYSQGFRDGCKVGAGNVGAGAYRMMEYKIDGDRLTGDKWYLRGFQDANTFCTFRIDWEIH